MDRSLPAAFTPLWQDPSSRVLLAALVSYTLLIAAFTGPPDLKWNEASRLGLVESLVERGTLSIDDASWPTGDKCSFDGHFYSDKPPLPAFLAAGIYLPLYHGLSLELSEHTGVVYRVLTFGISGLPMVALVVVFYLSLAHSGLGRVGRAGLTGVLALATPLLGWSSVFQNHVLAAAMLYAGITSFRMTLAPDRQGARWPLLAGLCVGAAVASDLSVVIFAFFLTLYLLTWRRDAALPFLLGMAPFAVFFALQNFWITGDILPAYLHAEGYVYPGSRLDAEIGGSAPVDSAALLNYAIRTQVGVEGYLSNTPFLILGVIGLIWSARRDPEIESRRFATVLLIGLLCVTAFYAYRSHDYGGWAFGFRYLLAYIPILVFGAAPLLRASWMGSRGWAAAVGLLVLVSLCFSLLCLDNPWRSTNHQLHVHGLGALAETWRG